MTPPEPPEEEEPEASKSGDSLFTGLVTGGRLRTGRWVRVSVAPAEVDQPWTADESLPAHARPWSITSRCCTATACGPPSATTSSRQVIHDPPRQKMEMFRHTRD